MTTPDVPGYNLQQALRDIAALRGQLAHLLANATFLNLTVATQFTAPDGAIWTVSGLNNLKVLTQFTAPDGAVWTSTGLSVDTWHSMTITGGWTVNTYAQYKKYPDKTVALRAYNLTPGTLTNATSIWTIPSGYIPATTQAFPVVVRSSTAIGTVPRVEVQSGGTMIIQDFQATTSSLFFGFRYALD